MRKFIKKFKPRWFKSKPIRIKKIFTARIFKRTALEVLRKKEILLRSVTITKKTLKNILVGLRPHCTPKQVQVKKPINKVVAGATTKHRMFYSFCSRSSLHIGREVGDKKGVKSYPEIYAALYKNRPKVAATQPVVKKKLLGKNIQSKDETNEFIKHANNNSVLGAVVKKQSSRMSKNWIPEDVWKRMTGTQRHEFLVKIGKIKI